MKITKTDFDDLVILEPGVIGDERGYFMEAYHYHKLKEAGIDIHFIQDNQSKSNRGVLRGLHFQNTPHAQTKLVRVLSGVILDVALDLRRDKETFGKAFLLELSSQNKKQLLVPKGFAHGFLVLSEEAEILYKCDEVYTPQAEGGIMYNDQAVNIQWGMSDSEIILSARDQNHPRLVDAKFQF